MCGECLAHPVVGWRGEGRSEWAGPKGRAHATWGSCLSLGEGREGREGRGCCCCGEVAVERQQAQQWLEEHLHWDEHRCHFQTRPSQAAAPRRTVAAAAVAAAAAVDAAAPPCPCYHQGGALLVLQGQRICHPRLQRIQHFLHRQIGPAPLLHHAGSLRGKGRHIVKVISSCFACCVYVCVCVLYIMYYAMCVLVCLCLCVCCVPVCVLLQRDVSCKGLLTRAQ